MAITVPVITTFNNKGLNDATDAFGRFGRKVGDIGKKAAAGLAAIGVAAVAGAAKAINLASDFAESQAKIRQILNIPAKGTPAYSRYLAKQVKDNTASSEKAGKASTKISKKTYKN